tara:strand:- start:1416 stop:2408 length:993 start_codon:yes stop_codon:yes gene_type:complete
MAGYIGATPVPQATQHREAFTATANQVSFATAGYTPQFIDIYLNGVKLAPSDYVATNGSDIVLATGAATGDILEYVAYTPFEVANQTFTGTTTLTDSGAAPLVVNRTTSDGDITVFQKDGTTIGSIGSISGDMFLATGVAGIRLTDSVPDIRPVLSDGSNSDATTNLGAGGDRFKDLYLSGGVYLGGIGAANKLDDYEEGTWLPSLLSDSGNVYQNTFRAGRYVKSGKQVTVSFVFKRNGAAVAGGSNMLLVGLPFAINFANGSYSQPFGQWSVGASGDGLLRGGPSGFGATNGNNIYLNAFGSNNNQLYNPASSTAADLISFQASYITS